MTTLNELLGEQRAAFVQENIRPSIERKVAEMTPEQLAAALVDRASVIHEIALAIDSWERGHTVGPASASDMLMYIRDMTWSEEARDLRA